MADMRIQDQYDGCRIPPEVYDVGFGWDPTREVNRLLHLASEADSHPASALELGCGTARLVAALQRRIPQVVGLDLSADMVQWARGNSRGEILVGDMRSFDLGRSFDLIYTSANTIRHVRTDADISRTWACIARHLTPLGVFIADLELGWDAELAKVGSPARWEISRGESAIRVSWVVTDPPHPASRCCTIEFSFEEVGDRRRKWCERFPLRTYRGPEFVRLATDGGQLELVDMYELRDPYLIATAPEKAVGRFLVVFRKEIGG